MSCGLGDSQFQIAACIDKRPAFMNLEHLEGWQGMVDGEIAAIGDACGNGWRKVFNVYAKLVWALAQDPKLTAALPSALSAVTAFGRWQDYRDASLLRADSGTALLFSEPAFSKPVFSKPGLEEPSAKPLYIVMGRGYGKSLANKPDATFTLEWLSESFAIDRHNWVIVCPYFDYRQLSDERICTLVTLVRELVCPLE